MVYGSELHLNQQNYTARCWWLYLVATSLLWQSRDTINVRYHQSPWLLKTNILYSLAADAVAMADD